MRARVIVCATALTLFSTSASVAAPSITNVSLPSGSCVFSPAPIEAVVTPVNGTTVIATLGGVTVPMKFNAPSTWYAAVDTSTFAMGAATLVITATDSTGASTTATSDLTLRADDNLVLVDSVPAGAIIDVDATRILYADTTTVHIKDRATGAITDLGAFGPKDALADVSGHLGSGGAVWTTGDWINGVTRQRTGQRLIHARGDWALLYDYDAQQRTSFYRMNLATGAIETVVDHSGTAVYQGNADIDAAGTLVYSDVDGSGHPQGHIVKVGGADTLAVSMGGFWVLDPVIDGSNIAWHKHMAPNGRTSIFLGSATTLDGVDVPGDPVTRSYADYRANNGWVVWDHALDDAATAGHLFLTAYTLSPGGVTARATALHTVTNILGLAPNGSIGYATDPTQNAVNGRAFVSAAGAAIPTVPVYAGTNVQLRWISGSWYALDGSSLYRVDETCVPSGGGGGGADAGTSSDDAGTSSDDAGTTSDDAGTSSDDAGTSSDDAATSGADSGSNAEAGPPIVDGGQPNHADGGEDHGSDPGEKQGHAGVGCTTVTGGANEGSPLGLVLVAAAMLRRRRYRDRTER